MVIIKKIDDYYLNMPIQEMFDLRELNSEEYKMFESVGIKRIFKDAKIYHGKESHFAGTVWDTMLAATGGCLYKISLQHITMQKEESDQVFKLTYEYLLKEMGSHSEHTPSSGNRYFWNSAEGNVILDQASIGGEYATQLFLTSSIISQQSEKSKQVLDAQKTAQKAFNAHRPSFLKWNPMHHTDEENLRWCWLRAVEWSQWPLFLSQSIAPILFIFFPWQQVVLSIFVLNLLWAFIRYRHLNVFLMTIGVYIVSFKWFVISICVVYFLMSKNYYLLLLSLFWPLVSFPLAIFTPTKIGILQEALMKQLGYSKKC